MRTPHETFQAMTEQLEAGLKQAFPVVTKDGKALQLVKLHAPTLPDPHDFNAQKSAIMAGQTWGTPLKATVALLGPDGKQVDKKEMRLGTLPTPTNRHTFILNGKEYQVNYQRRLKPGIYTKFNRLGEALADFNLAQGRNFSVGLDPNENKFFVRYGNTHVPLLPVLQGLYQQKSLGLGKDFDHPVSNEDISSALKTMHTMVLPNAPVPDNLEAVKGALKEKLGQARFDPAVTAITVGRSHENVSGTALQDAAKQVLAVHRRDALPSTKEQLAFTEVYGVEDFLHEKFVKGRSQLRYRLAPALATKTELAKINVKGPVDGLLKEFFIGSVQSNVVQQINPLEMKENAFKLTSLGEGAIGDTHAISPEVRVIHPSSMGFIDPVRTPDNAKAGVDVRLAVHTKKIGKQIYTRVKDVKTGQFVMKSPVDLYDAVAAHDVEPQANGLVRAVHRGAVVDVPVSRVQYILPADDSFTVSTTLVPFLQNTHAHRAAMGAKMLGQAVSLLDREAPLVTTPHAEKGINDFLIKAPVAGVVTDIKPGVIQLKDAQNRIHRVAYPHEFPLNGHSFLHGEVRVRVGERVNLGQLLVDNNFSRNGQVALGKNLTVAYMPYKGLNHEDAVVVTRQGADKLISQHLHTLEAVKDDRTIYSKQTYQAHFPGEYENKHFDKLDTDGVVRVGTILEPNDPIILGLRKRLMSPEQLLLGKANKGVINPMVDTTQIWDRPYPGKVSAVEKTGSNIKVTITANATLQVGDKVAGRHGNKGVVSVILPNEEAPRTADGKIPDVILNSAGLTSRMNNGQLYEVIAGKAIQKLGLPAQTFPHFSGVNTWNMVKTLRDKAKVSETEELFDPQTKRSLGHTLMGPMYVLKLFKQAESGFSARAGGEYDVDLRPAKGGEDGAKSLGTLDFFGLLSHGSRNLLADAHQKSEFNPDAMAALWKGQPLPPPKPTFAWNKFQGMLTAMGLNVKKTGNQLALLPLRDQDVLAMSNGKVHEPLTVLDKPDPVTNLPFRPEPGGLFDPTVTGGLVGNRWSHVSLHEPVLNPIFRNAARTILNMPKAQFEQTLYEKGAGHIQQQLAAIDPGKRIAELQKELEKTNSTSKRDTIYKQIKYLRPLVENNMAPASAYVLNHVPVLPPSMRPIYPDPQTGRMVVSDANQLYKNLLLVNQQLRTHSGLGDASTTSSLRKGLHEAVAAVQGMDGTPEKLGYNQAPPPSGFLKVITGTAQAKDGFFQSKLLSRRQDVAARGVIVPDTSLGIDEVGLPKQMAMTLYRHHGVGELVQSGMPLLKAAEEFENQTPTAVKAVQVAMQKFPAIVTRAPSLHKFNLLGLKPQLVDGKSIRLNTLVLKGMNADFDGDQSNIHVPISPEGAADARRMMPSANLFSPLNNSPVHVPSQETVLGLWKATAVKSAPVRRFPNKAAALAAYHAGQIRITDPIEIG
jgi:DNA-directed RNA polymerase beta subunit